MRGWTSFICAMMLLIPAQASATIKDDVRRYREANEKIIVGEFVDLLSLPNVAANRNDIARNVKFVDQALTKRGFTTRILSAGEGTPPAVFGELKSKHAKRTIIFYAHMDGQPAGQPGWSSPAWEPVVRSGGPLDRPPLVNWKAHQGLLGPEWRIYARSASDDKGAIAALLAALDAVNASGRAPSVNIKVFIESEEEDGSPHLRAILAQNRDLLKADGWILCDGPVHQSGRRQVIFGVRGVTGLDLTVYGPLRPLHSGHFGNWAPNPASRIAGLLAEMRNSEGRILIPGFYDDVEPMEPAGLAAMAKVPNVDEKVRKELAIAKPEGEGRIIERTLLPALNITGIAAGGVGEQATNSIPTFARAAIDFRLVPGETPERVKERVEAFLRQQGWHLVNDEPDSELRLAHPKLARLKWSLDYAAHRTPLDHPLSVAIIQTLQSNVAPDVITVPFLGGSIPMSVFAESFGVPVVIVPIANYDNNQHGADENLRLQNLWDGIETYAALIAGLNW